MVVLAIIISGFLPIFRASNTDMLSFPSQVKSTLFSVETTTIRTQSQSVSVSVTTGVTVTTVNNEIYNVSSILIACGHWIYQAISLNGGGNVELDYAASGNLDLFVFNKAEYGVYSSSNGNTSSPNIVQ